MPASGGTISGIAPTAVDTTAVRLAIASRMTHGTASPKLGNTNTSAC